MAAPWDGRLATYLGVGVIGDRPAAPNIAPGLMGVWFATDVPGVSYWNSDPGVLAWVDEPWPLTTEEIQDMLDTFIVAGPNIIKTYDDVANTLTLEAVQRTDESIQDMIAAFIIAGINMGVTYDDVANTLTFDGLSTEAIQDMIGTFIAAGTNMTVTYDDAGNQLVIAGLTDAQIKSKTNYWVPLGFATTPTTNEKLLLHVFGETVTFADEWLGSVSYPGVNPAATFVLTIYKNGSSVGTITISTSGVVTWVTTGTTVTFNSGDCMEVRGPAVADTAIANWAFNMKGAH